MSNFIDGSETGEFAFIDSDGLLRFRGRTCNLYGDVEDAKAAAERLYDEGESYYIWRTVDGLYDFSLTDEANDGRLPELVDATCVGPFTVAGSSGVLREPEKGASNE